MSSYSSAVLQSVDEKFRPWLKGQLEFSNEPKLHDRLAELISELPQQIRNVLLKPSDDMRFEACTQRYIEPSKWPTSA